MRVSARAALLVTLAAICGGDSSADVVEARRPASAAAPSPEWMAQVDDSIVQSEYRFAQAGPGAFTAPNRAHDLRFRADRERLILAARGAKQPGGPSWELSVHLSRWGREDRLAVIDGADPQADGARLEYRRKDLIEWYANDERGLEQGFEIPQPPGKPVERRPLILEMEISSPLGAYPIAGGREILFKDTHSAVVLRCAGLKVLDASERAVPARFEVRPGVLRIVIEDSQAIYPIAVDPVFTTPSWTLYGGQIAAQFGRNAGTAGDVNKDGYSDVIVSAHMYDNGQVDEGRVYLYLGSPTGVSTTPAWTAESDQASALFGFAAGPAGDVNGDGFADVVVSALTYDNGETDEGVVFVYYGWLGGLQTAPARVLEINQAAARFGQSAATAGDVNGDGYGDIIVGANQYDNGEVDEGEAFVYLGGPAGVAASPAWRAEMNVAGALLGASVAGAGDTNGDGYDDVIVGASSWTNGHSLEGAAFVWLGGPSGPAVAPAWQTEANFSSANLGAAVAGAGDVNGDGYADVLVGAPNYGPTFARTGRAFLYLGSSTGPQLPAAWFTVGQSQSARYGGAVATAGDVNADGYADILIGSPGYIDFYTNEGAAYLFLGSSTGPSLTESWFAQGGGMDVRLGGSVAPAGDVDGDGYAEILIGSSTMTLSFGSEGRAQLYRGAPASLSYTPAWTGESNQPSSLFGFGLAGAGDVNGDGFTDVIVGCPACDNGESDEGMAFVFLGGPAGLAATPAWSAESNQVGAQLGHSVAGAGDVNGDGYGDVIVGAWLYDNGQDNEGAAFVYLGGAAGLQSTAAWRSEGNQTLASYGFSVAGAGDVNGDGFGDVIVGAPDMDDPESEEGMAFLYLGSPSGPGAAPGWTSEGDQAGASHGYSVAPAGDMNQDGYSDVVVGAPGYDYNGRIDSGRASVFMGTPSGLRPLSIWDLVIWSPGAALGREVSTAGDVNGDGYSDIIVGAPFDDFAGADAGTALVLYGSARMFTSPVTFLDGAAGWYAGSSVDTAGDVNGDGYSDVIVGAYAFTSVLTPIPNEGLANVYLGSALGVSTSSWSPTGGQAQGFFGRRVRFAGDVNSDGFSDVVVGAPNNSNGQTGEGMVYLWYGGGTDGLHMQLLQKTTTDTANVSPLGWSDDEDGIALNVRARTPAGRSRVRVETEIKNLSVGFNGSGTWLSGWADTGTPLPVDGSAAAIHEVYQPLFTSPSRMQRWRTRFVTVSPFFPHSRWFWLWANAPGEGDIWLAGCRDIDGDGYGSPASALCPAGAAPDCNDSSAAIHPGAPETCDGLDNDCNNLVDDVRPPGPPDLDLLATGKLVWLNQPGTTASDLVRGDLGLLGSTHGDFTAALSACLRNDTPASSYLDLDIPAPQEAFWYLVRPIGCGVPGSYDEGVASQIGSRDAEIAAAAGSCP